MSRPHTAADTKIHNTQEYIGGHHDALAAIGVSFLARGQQEDKVKDHLLRHFNVHYIMVYGFWAELTCHPAIPEGRLPSLVGGLVAIWRHVTDYAFMPFIGKGGQLGEDESEESAAVAAAFPGGDDGPTDAAVIKLADFFADCQAITLVHPTAIIEFPPTDPKAFRDRLSTLPSSIAHLPYVLRYHNGPLPNTPRRGGAQIPKPEVDVGETDHVERDGLYPGTMISSVDEDGSIHTSSAGILVENGGETRLTCSWQCWEHHEQDTQETRRDFRIVQGTPGTEVGRVVRRIGTTDIALAKLSPNIKFENRFVDRDIQVTAKKLVHSTNTAYFDELLIDTFQTGVHRLLSVGSRIVFEKGRRLNGDDSLLPPSTCIAAWQGVCATGDPVFTEKLCIRDRACGAVLLRCKDDSGGDVMARGEVCGMLCYADLTPKYAYSASEHLIYYEHFDPLIEEGWQVVPLSVEEAETTEEVKRDIRDICQGHPQVDGNSDTGT